MFGKKFGLKEAEQLARAAGCGDVSIPTVKATLAVLGVANTVGQEVAKVTACLKGGVDNAVKSIGVLRMEDTNDDEETAERIQRAEAERKERARRNAEQVVAREGEIAEMVQRIAALESLGRRFGS